MWLARDPQRADFFPTHFAEDILCRYERRGSNTVTPSGQFGRLHHFRAALYGLSLCHFPGCALHDQPRSQFTYLFILYVIVVRALMQASVAIYLSNNWSEIVGWRVAHLALPSIFNITGYRAFVHMYTRSTRSKAKTSSCHASKHTRLMIVPRGTTPCIKTQQKVLRFTTHTPYHVCSLPRNEGVLRVNRKPNEALAPDDSSRLGIQCHVY